MIQSLMCFGLINNINIVNIPFDKGANKQGSKYAFKTLKPSIDSLNLNVDNIYNIEDCDKSNYRNIFGDAFMACWKILNEDKLPFLIGGDHTCAISSVFASNEYCLKENKKLGVLWCDAHADFNTMQTSPSGNIHGVPVSVLCGHTLPALSYGESLSPSQFAYFGVRDIDSIEFDRFQEFNMKYFNYKVKPNENEELKEWIDQYDAIHVSFDMDCFDPMDFPYVNTGVLDGPCVDNIYNLMNVIRESNKLLSLDIVEYNPINGSNNTLIIELLKNVF